MKKLKEVERLIAEAPKFKFNTNIFKKNVQLDMTAEEIREEEKNVENLSKYITEKAIPNLAQDLKQQEGIPIDSQSLKDFLHKRGINMRYLGAVLAAMDKHPETTESKSIHILLMMGDYKHVKTLLEREIFLRSAKHVINRILKEGKGESDLHLAQTVSHCLNCILAPLPFIQAMNSGKLKPIDEALQNKFQSFPEEIRSPLRNRTSSISKAPKEEVASSEAKASDVDKALTTHPEQMTKKKLKKLKQKQNKYHSVATVAEEKPSAPEVTEMSQILFKQNEVLASA